MWLIMPNRFFHFKKSTTYNFINIGKMFMDVEKLASNLKHTEHDYSLSQLVRLVPLGSAEVANELIEQDKFNENSTIKEIEKAVKEYNSKDEQEQEEEEQEQEEQEEEEQAQPEIWFKIVKCDISEDAVKCLEEVIG